MHTKENGSCDWGRRIAAVAFCLWAAAAAGEEVFRRSMDRVASMDPAASSSLYSSRAVHLVYETLLDVDYLARPYRLIPLLATEVPKPSEDGRTYIIRLDPEARFHPDPCFGTGADGRPKSRGVTADDIVFSLKRLGDSKLASPGSWLVEDSIEGMRLFVEKSKAAAPTDYGLPVKGLEAVDAHTVRITLTRPMHQFVWYLAMTYVAAVPREAVEKYGADFGSHAVGSGAFMLTGWRRNHEMDFTRDPTWRGWAKGPAALRPGDPLVPFDRVVYYVIDDVSTQWLCFLAGEVDFLGEISRDNWDVVVDSSGKLSEALNGRGVTLYDMPTLEDAYIGMNMEDPVLGPNKALRQALNCAFDSAAWMRFYNNRVFPCDGPVPPGTAGRLETPFPYAFNLERARQLMREAGYPDGIDGKTGRRLELTMDLGRTSQDTRESSELMVAFYARIGVSLVPQYHNWPTFLRRVAERRSQMFRVGWIGDYPDAENFLQLFYSKNVSPGPNRCNYVNPEFDRLYEAACAAKTEAERDPYWRKAQEIVREDCPWVFLHFRRDYTLCGPRVKNYKPSDFPYGSERYLRTPRRGN
jgi:oligopeptide transport system substrate-binding protein